MPTFTDVSLPVGDRSMRACVATPDAPPTAAVVVIPEAFGLNGHIERVTRKVADAGMVGIGLDIFHRSGGGVAPYTDFKQVMALFEGMNDDTLIADNGAAVAYLGTLGFAPSSIAVVGFCFGGRVAFLAGLTFPLAAAVSYYGGGIASQGAFKAFPPLIDRVGELKAPVLALFGDRDKSIPVDEVEQLRQALAGTPSEVVRYADSDHGFNCDERPSFDAQAADDAWTRTITFIRQHTP